MAFFGLLKCTFGVSGFRSSVAGRGICTHVCVCVCHKLHCAWTLFAIILFDAVPDDAHDKIIRNQASLFHDVFSLASSSLI